MAQRADQVTDKPVGVYGKIIDKVKNIPLQPIKDAVQKIAGEGINAIPGISAENKEALNKIKDQLADKVDVKDKKIGNIVPMKGPGGVMPTDKAPAVGPTDKPTEPIPKFKGISGWDKFKNFLGGIGGGLGLTTHKITDADYIWNPDKKKWVFDWKTARENDAKAGRATETKFDPTKLIGLASKVIK